MKFCEMSWKELEKDFKDFLDNFSTEELVESLREYVINEENYSFEFHYENNLNESSLQEDVNIVIKDKAYIEEDIINDNDILEVYNEKCFEMEGAA